MLGQYFSFTPQIAGFLPDWMLFVSSPKFHYLIWPLSTPTSSKLLDLANSLTNRSQVSVVSLFNTAQCYSTLHFCRRIYSEDPTAQNKSPEKPSSQVTALSARTFGTWTLLTAIVRLFAAYNLNNPAFFALGFCTYLVALLHFFSEWLVFGTAKWGAPLMGPAFVSTGTLTWMILQKGFYLSQ